MNRFLIKTKIMMRRGWILMWAGFLCLGLVASGMLFVGEAAAEWDLIETNKGIIYHANADGAQQTGPDGEEGFLFKIGKENDPSCTGTCRAVVQPMSIWYNHIDMTVPLNTTDAVTVGTTLGVTGATTLSGGASISGGLNNNSGGITGAGAISEATTIGMGGALTGATTIDASGTITGGNLSTGGTLGVTGATTLSGGASISGGLNNNTGGITGAGAISGATAIGMGGALTGATTIDASGTITGGNLSTGGTLSVTGATTTNGITNTGAIATTTLNTSGAATVGNGLTVSAGGASITGNSTVTGTLGVSSNATVGGSLGVTGATTTNGITNTGAIATTTLNTSGAATIGNGLTVSAGGATITGNLTATGANNLLNATTNTIANNATYALADSAIEVVSAGVHIKGLAIDFAGNTGVTGTMSSTGNTTLATNAGTINTFGSGANSNNTIGNAGASTNTITGTTNTLTSTTSNTMATTGGGSVSTTSAGAAITGATNTNTATTSNIMSVTGGGSVTATAGGTAIAGTTNTISGNTTISAPNGGSFVTGPTTASMQGTGALATNWTVGNGMSNTGAGAVTVHNASDVQIIPANSTIANALAGKVYQNKVNGNLFVDGNAYINGTLDFVSTGSAATTVVGGTGSSILPNPTQGTSGGTNIVMKGTNGATESMTSITLTNGYGNTHGVEVYENRTIISGGINSTTMTLNDDGARFANTTGGPAKVTGVADGSGDFDAVNYRQLEKAYMGIASTAALAAIPNTMPGKRFAIGAGYGNFEGQSAVAIGVKASILDSVSLTVGVGAGVGNSKTVVTPSAGISWSF